MGKCKNCFRFVENDKVIIDYRELEWRRYAKAYQLVLWWENERRMG